MNNTQLHDWKMYWLFITISMNQNVADKYALSTINTSNYEYQIIESSDHLEMTNE